MSVMKKVLAFGVPVVLGLVTTLSLALAGPVGPATSELAGPVAAAVEASPTPPPPAWFTVEFVGSSEPAALREALASLRAAGRLSVVEDQSVPGRVLVQGDPTAAQDLAAIPGVVAVRPSGPPLDGAAANAEQGTPLLTYIVLVRPGASPAARAQVEAALEVMRSAGAIAEVTDLGQAFQVRAADHVKPALQAIPGVQSVDLARPVADSGVHLLADGTIKGTVTEDGTNAPLMGVTVYAYQASPYVYEATTTDASGNYTINVPPGSYRVTFQPADRHIVEYYNNTRDYSAATMVSVADGGLTANINASLAVGFQVKGTVTGQATSLPLAGAGVYVSSDTASAYASTDASGNYTTAPGLPAGSYQVQFSGPSGGNYATEYYQNQVRPGLANLVTITSADATGINAALDPGGTVAGTFAGGSTLNGVYAYVYFNAENAYASSATSNASGEFRIPKLAASSYRLYYYDPQGRYVTGWYNGATAWDNATPISAAGGATTTLGTISLVQAGVISGTVTADGTSTPLAGVSVTAYDALTGSSKGSNTTNASGVFRIGGLLAGSYKLRFVDSNGVYLTEYFDNQPDLASGTPIGVSAGVTSTILASLAPGGHVAGRVVDALTGAGLSGLEVSISRLDGSGSGSATTDAGGYYTSTALSTGVYRASFNGNSRYHGEYYDNQASSYGATPIAVTTGLTITGIDARLRSGHIISGTVSAPGPLGTVYVHAYRASDSYYTAFGYTDGSGVYRLGPLSAGSYRIFFTSSDQWAPQWYGGASYGAATVVNVAGDVGGIDTTLTAGSRIVGTVTNAEGSPLSGVSVYVYPAGQGSSLASATTAANGQFVAKPTLLAGAYQVSYSYAGTTIWYNGKSSQATASPLTVTLGVTATANAQFTSISGLPGGITGTIRAADTSLPIGGYVYAHHAATNGYVTSSYAPAGSFTLSGLPAGSYHLYFSPLTPSSYLKSYYNGKASLAEADSVAVTAGVTRTDIAFSIQRGGTLTGQVTGPAGIPGVTVNATRVTTEGYASVTGYTGVDGAYHLDGLEPGGYRVSFTPLPPYQMEYYDNAPSTTSATTVTVSAGVTATNINAALESGASITGTLTGAGSGERLMNSYVYFYTAAGASAGFVVTDMDGGYVSPALPAGQYKALFYPPSGSQYRQEWYANAATMESALTITVPASGYVPNVNVELEQGGSISGYIYDASTGFPISGVFVYAYDATTGSYINYGYSNSWGAYQIPGQPTGSYHLKTSSTAYVDRWYPNSIDEAGATAVSVSAGSDTPNINITLAPKRTLSLPVIVQGTAAP